MSKTALLKPAPNVITVTVRKRKLMGVKWRHDVKSAVVSDTFVGFAVFEVLYPGDRIDAVNGVPTNSPSEVVSAWRAVQHDHLELTIQREEMLQVVANKPAPSGDTAPAVSITWLSHMSPVVSSVQLSGGAKYISCPAQNDSLKIDGAGILFEYSPSMLWPLDLVVAINGVASGDALVFDDILLKAQGQITISIQRGMKPPLVPDTTCGCLDFFFRTRPSRPNGVNAVITTAGSQRI